MPIPGITDTFEMMRYQGPGAPLVPGRVTVTALVQARWEIEDGSD